MTQTRRMQVLRAVVEDYIRSQEPVGSSSLIAHHKLTVSSATIRKDMAALENEGYLTHPHTSAGRIPTERGYRYFVDSLPASMPLTDTQRETIRTYLDNALNLQDALQGAAKILSQFTGQVAVVASPALSKSQLWHLEIIAVSSTTVLIVVVTDTGRVAQHILNVAHLPTESQIHTLCDTVNAQGGTLTLRQTAALIRSLHNESVPDMGRFIEQIAQAFETMANEDRTHELFMSGVSQLTTQHANARDLKPLFDALEEQAQLMQLMTHLCETSTDNRIGVAIGSETQTPGLLHASVISGGYGKIHVAMNTETSNTRETPIAFVGSIGPTHMNYEIAIAAVQAVAKYLTMLISRNGIETTR